MHLTNPILFDLDNTLIDTAKLMRVSIIPALEKILKITPTEFDELNQRYRDTLSDPTKFNPQAYVEHLSVTFDVPAKALYKAFMNERFFKDALFNETIAVLESLQDQYELGIFSQALITEYQLAKLSLSGILPFFSQELLFIRADKTSAEVIKTLPKSATIIDDRLRFLEPLASVRPDLQLFWLNRASSEKNPQFVTIHSLEELL